MPRITPLKLLIAEKRLIQADVAEDSSMTESRLSRIVNGRTQPQAYEFKNLAHALGMEKEHLEIQLKALSRTMRIRHAAGPSGREKQAGGLSARLC